MTTTMGKLLEWNPPDSEIDSYQRLIMTLEEIYPDNWKDWVVNVVSYEDLFGETLSPDVEARLRFAVPTVRLAAIFNYENPFSERRYKLLKRKLLKWPISLALIYQPLSIMAKVHPICPENKFEAMLPSLKIHLLSRKAASELLKSESEKPNSACSSKSIAKRSRSQDSESNSKKLKGTDCYSDETLSKYMRQQNEILVKLYELTYTFVHSSQSPHSETQWSMCANRTESTANECNLKNNDNWNANNKSQEKPNLFVDFTPETKESESKILKATYKMVELGLKCQKLGTEGWQNIPYEEEQKEFQATPIFTSLKVNSHLASVKFPWELRTVLEKTDIYLGAITHGLLLQRAAFEDAYAKAPFEVKAYISRHFLTKDTDFRKFSDSLLQYTCGKRSEVLEERRALYRPQNEVLCEMLHAIPPSSTHLFAEPQLSDFVKEQGGVSNVLLKI